MSRFGPLAILGFMAAVISSPPEWHQLLAQTKPPTDARSPQPTRLTRTHFSKFFLRYSPDGSKLAYATHYANRRAANLVLVGMRLMNADGSNDGRIFSRFDREVQIQEHPCFMPDGKSLLFSGGGNDTGNSAKDVFIADLDEKRETKQLRKLVPGPSVQLGEEPAVSPDGKLVAFVTINEQLRVYDLERKQTREVVQVDGSYCHQPDWSPDGEWLAFASDRDGNIEIYKVRVDGTELTRLTNSPGIDARPRWSPDGQWLCFTSHREGNQDIFAMRADGSGLRNLTRHPSVDDHAAWHPSGKSIAFVSQRDGGYDIYSLSVPSDMKVAAKPPKQDRGSAETKELVAYYRCDSVVDGKRVRDEVGRNHMELKGARLDVANGRGAMFFDGKQAYATCGNTTPLQLGGPLTLSFWVRPAGQAGNGYVVSKFAWNVYLSAGTPNFETRTANNDAWDTLRGTTKLKENEWTFLTAVFDPAADELRLFVNGRLEVKQPRRDKELGNFAGAPLVLGHYVASQSQHYHGWLDELRIYRVALSADRIAAAYKSERSQLPERLPPAAK